MKEHVRLRNYVSYAQECFMNVYGRVKSITSRQPNMPDMDGNTDTDTDIDIDTDMDMDTNTDTDMDDSSQRS